MEENKKTKSGSNQIPGYRYPISKNLGFMNLGSPALGFAPSSKTDNYLKKLKEAGPTRSVAVSSSFTQPRLEEPEERKKESKTLELSFLANNDIEKKQGDVTKGKEKEMRVENDNDATLGKREKSSRSENQLLTHSDIKTEARDLDEEEDDEDDDDDLFVALGGNLGRKR